MCDLGNELATTLKIGDNLVVNVKEGNDEGVSFWLIMCTEPLCKVTKAFTNGWGISFEEGDDVIGGIYYQKWGHIDTSYVLLKDSKKSTFPFTWLRLLNFLCHLGIIKLMGTILFMNC
jgi:hypothetical protein